MLWLDLAPEGGASTWLQVWSLTQCLFMTSQTVDSEEQFKENISPKMLASVFTSILKRVWSVSLGKEGSWNWIGWNFSAGRWGRWWKFCPSSTRLDSSVHLLPRRVFLLSAASVSIKQRLRQEVFDRSRRSAAPGRSRAHCHHCRSSPDTTFGL